MAKRVRPQRVAQEVPVSMASQAERDSIRVRRGPIDSITVYEVTEQELDDLERGGDGGTYLNFALSLISIALSFLIALTTTTIASDRKYTTFVIVSVGSTLGALVFLVLWWRNRKSVKEVIAEIRDRAPPEEVDDTDKDAEAVDKTSKPPGK